MNMGAAAQLEAGEHAKERLTQKIAEIYELQFNKKVTE